MLTCPVCDTPNDDGSLSCERCNCALDAELGDTIQPAQLTADQQTVVAPPSFSHASGAAAVPARTRPTANDLPTGRVLIGRYEILERLGQGGMGTVYRVLDRELDRIVALKTIRADLASNTVALRRLKQETLLARQIAHRNVIRVFDLGVADELRFITMEFVEGRDLRNLLDERKKLEEGDAVAILTQIAQGLSAAHSEDVVHRDLKPHNILLSGDRVRIVDFGLARSFENTGITHSGMILGTPAYMSPEQALGQQGDVRSDIFSFGIIAFELLTGELPFPSQTLTESLLSRTRGRARALDEVDPNISKWLTRVVMRCLERLPEDRYPGAREIVDDLLARDVWLFPAASRQTGALAPGTMLGSRYRIESEAGEGGMGKVYRATDLDLHRTVALKVVRPDLADNPDTLDQLMHEISIASQISHKNVLRIHDLGEAGGLRFVSMAWAEGEDLRHLLRRAGPLPEERIRELAEEIAEGLEAAHEQGISHRDLKPSNILLTSGGHACIADFGLARSLRSAPLAADLKAIGESSSLSLSSTGTPRYMSPEQVDGVNIDHRTDIYSFGLILYEMSTGRIPFNDESVFQTLTQRITEAPPSPKLFNPTLSDQLTRIVIRCLQRDPEQRYGTVRELLDELRRAPAQPLALLGEVPVRRAGAGRRWLLPAGLITAVLAAAAGGWFWQRSRVVVTPPPDGKYIAVLPFRSVGSDPNLKYRAEGIAEAVSARLSALGSLHPVSASALDRVNLAQPEEAIGKAVGANLLVRGSVQSQGDRLKVDASIYNIEKRQVLWSKSYQGVAEDLFALEDEISSDTERALKVNPTIAERERQARAPTQNLAAYDLYLKGRDVLKNHRDEASAKSALGLFEQAIQQDDSFALAWTGVADASLLLYGIQRDSVYAEKALAAAQSARERNDQLPEVHFTLGSLYSATGKNAQAVDEIKHALALAPNSDNGYIRLGKAYHATGQTEAELTALKKAVELNPFYWYNHKQLGVGYMDAGRYDDALKEFKEQIAENPQDPSGYINTGAAYFSQGRWKEGIPAFEKAIKIQPSFRAYTNLATAYYMLGRYSEAIPAYEKALAMSPKQAWVARNLAETYTRAGQKEKGTELYTRAISLLYDQLQVNSQDAFALGDLALCYVAKGDLAQAHLLISRARAINNTEPELLYASAVVNSASGRMPEALAALKGALQHGSDFMYCLSDPDLQRVRALPGFAALEKEFGPSQARGARRR